MNVPSFFIIKHIKQSVHTMDRIRKWFDDNWVAIACELAAKGQSQTYQEYTSRDDLPADIRDYHKSSIPVKTSLIQEFEGKLSEGIVEYVRDRNSSDRSVRMTAYDKFFNHPEGMQLAREIYRRGDIKIQQPPLEIVEKLHAIIKSAHPRIYDHPVDFHQGGGNLSAHTDEKIISIVEDCLLVKLHRNWWLGSTKLQLHNWWHQWGLQRYDVYDCNYGKTSSIVGTVIVKHDNLHPPTTTPMLTSVPTQFVITSGGSNLAHELTHAVNFCFVDYYEIPRELIEIAPMCMENVVNGKRRWSAEGNPELVRQSALALADIEARDPDEFNTLFAMYTRVNPTKIGHVRARMWHTTNMPGKYYSYVLGMASFNYTALAKAVRSANRGVIMKCTE